MPYRMVVIDEGGSHLSAATLFGKFEQIIGAM
jgi:hypothetical protein